MTISRLKERTGTMAAKRAKMCQQHVLLFYLERGVTAPQVITFAPFPTGVASSLVFTVLLILGSAAQARFVLAC